MAQFDFIIILPVLWSLILVLVFNYWFIIEILLPKFSSLLKFRKKILTIPKFKILFIKQISVYV